MKTYFVIISVFAASAICWTGNTPTGYTKGEIRTEIVYSGDCKPCQAAVLQQSNQQKMIPNVDSAGIRIVLQVDTCSSVN
jgi:hypothetical protein